MHGPYHRLGREAPLLASWEARLQRDSLKAEAALGLGYYVVVIVYLFLHQENELQHYVTLVAVPLALILIYQRSARGTWSPRHALRTIGLEKGNLTSGLVWAIPLGLAISLVMQLFFSRNAAAFRELITSGRALYLLPIALALLVFTVGVTEEVFFRGVLQTRLTELAGSKVVAILIVSALFGLYHLPYAYLNPNWPSSGDLGAAFQAAMSNGILGGVVIGGVYAWANNNLIAAILVHSFIDLFPAMTLIKFGG